MSNVPIPNLTSPIAVVLVDPLTGFQYRLGGSSAASPLANVPNVTMPQAVVAFNTVTQALMRI